eukprot:CAMPEP_0117665722 /NCGR_PEP_ID=MMETSP0804-20121206/9972_1 /TAXON_ID=1074897 /ORGANISM="Tetraselmis astigmatica, Strain CCMP880" /LENGTH=708 /DNA_ID=CAMNT_0005473175 /DNA_START=360 /DNA_END=2490 /DNA_ORIENTATION=-
MNRRLGARALEATSLDDSPAAATGPPRASDGNGAAGSGDRLESPVVTMSRKSGAKRKTPATDASEDGGSGDAAHRCMWTPLEDEIHHPRQVAASLDYYSNIAASQLKPPAWERVADAFNREFEEWKNCYPEMNLQVCFRDGKSCRSRWKYHVSLARTRRGEKTPFSEAEDEYIIYMQSQINNKWSQISALLSSESGIIRTDNDVKNRWNSKLARVVQQRLLDGPPLPTAPPIFPSKAHPKQQPQQKPCKRLREAPQLKPLVDSKLSSVVPMEEKAGWPAANALNQLRSVPAPIHSRLMALLGSKHEGLALHLAEPAAPKKLSATSSTPASQELPCNPISSSSRAASKPATLSRSSNLANIKQDPSARPTTDILRSSHRPAASANVSANQGPPKATAARWSRQAGLAEPSSKAKQPPAAALAGPGTFSDAMAQQFEDRENWRPMPDHHHIHHHHHARALAALTSAEVGGASQQLQQQQFHGQLGSLASPFGDSVVHHCPELYGGSSMELLPSDGAIAWCSDLMHDLGAGGRDGGTDNYKPQELRAEVGQAASASATQLSLLSSRSAESDNTLGPSAAVMDYMAVPMEAVLSPSKAQQLLPPPIPDLRASQIQQHPGRFPAPQDGGCRSPRRAAPSYLGGGGSSLLKDLLYNASGKPGQLLPHADPSSCSMDWESSPMKSLLAALPDSPESSPHTTAYGGRGLSVQPRRL